MESSISHTVPTKPAIHRCFLFSSSLGGLGRGTSALMSSILAARRPTPPTATRYSVLESTCILPLTYPDRHTTLRSEIFGNSLPKPKTNPTRFHSQHHQGATALTPKRQDATEDDASRCAQGRLQSHPHHSQSDSILTNRHVGRRRRQALSQDPEPHRRCPQGLIHRTLRQ